MAEYISRETMIKLVRSMAENAETNGFMHDREVIECVMTTLGGVPLADVAPVVHGKWLKPEYEYHVGICSLCGCVPLKPAFRSTHYNYCPNCGAKMDEGKGDFIE